MPTYTASIGVLSVITAGLFALCQTTFATAGWTAPACLATGVVAVVDLILAAAHDGAANAKEEADRNPDKAKGSKKAVVEPEYPAPFRMGHILLHEGDHSTPSYNMTREILKTMKYGVPYNMTNGEHGGFQHTLTFKDDRTLQVKTNMNSGTNAGTACKMPRRTLQERISKYDDTYNELHIESFTKNKKAGIPGKTAGANIGRKYANYMYRLGSYCSYISTAGDPKFLHLALTANGKGEKMGYFTPALCTANGHRVKEIQAWTIEE